MKHKKTQAVKQSSQQNEILLLVGFLSLILLHVVGGFWHSYYSWGFSYWSIFSTNTVVVVGVTSISLLLAAYYYRSRIKLDFIVKTQISNKSKVVTVVMYGLIFIGISAILYFFRSKAHIYGDGFQILGNIRLTEDVFAESKNYMELFTIYLYYYISTLVQQFGNISSENILGAINSIAGAFGLWGIWSISKLISHNRDSQYFIFITALSSASLLLFFGYIENYTLSLVSAIWLFRFSIGYIKEENGSLSLIVFSILSLGFHLITFPFIIVAIYAVFLRADKIDLVVRLRKTAIALFFVLSTLIIVFICQSKGLTIFVPIWSILNNPYSLFSFGHINDFFNQLILVAPLSFLLIINFLRLKKNKAESTSNYSKILYMLSVLTLLSSFFIDPQLGAVRDWDLLSFYGIPLTIYAGYSFTRLYVEVKFPHWLIIASSIIVIIHIVPNLYEKNRPEIAVEYLDKVLWDDPHYQSDYLDAYRGNSWGYILKNELKRDALAEKYFVRRHDSKTNDVEFWYAQGVRNSTEGKYDIARNYLQKGFELYPQDPRFLSELSDIESQTKNYSLAEKYARESLKLNSNHVPGLTALAILLINQNQPEEALNNFRKAYDLEPEDVANITNLGIIYSREGVYDSANYYLQKSLLLTSDTQKLEILGSLVSISLELQNKNKAIEYLNQLKKLAPNSSLIREKEKEIYE